MTARERSGATVTDPAARPAPLGWLRAAVADRESLRSWTLVANDGIIATAGILEGFAGAGASNRTLITAATTATIAGMLTVGGAEWAEAAAEREAQLTAAEEEAADIARQPHVERAELVAYYEAKGLTPHLARDVADQLMARDALDAQLESEHGILEVMSRAQAVRVGIGSAIAYLLGAAIPLSVTAAVPVAIESPLILAAVVVSLIVTSGIGARTGHMNLSRTLVRTLTVGLATMAVSYLVGRLVF
ncbi:MAG TPA: VIT1/CCC1 transporter family protein [Solirubrobacteraceae bacterium]|nr:VIT1/CCC1 transporter family protein [Solirubrobacteraceae bacterium]